MSILEVGAAQSHQAVLIPVTTMVTTLEAMVHNVRQVREGTIHRLLADTTPDERELWLAAEIPLRTVFEDFDQARVFLQQMYSIYCEMKAAGSFVELLWRLELALDNGRSSLGRLQKIVFEALQL